jgi:hypothetical protein
MLQTNHLKNRHTGCNRPSHTKKKIMKIVVIGRSGFIGTKVVAQLRNRGREVIAGSPNTGINSITGEGLAEAGQMKNA